MSLLGCERPRIFTPPLRKLEPRSPATEARTLGYAVIDFATNVLLIDLLPWQRWLVVHMLELLPDGSLRFRTVLVLVARQNGKSTLSVVLSLFFMYVLARKLVIGTAQDLDVAEEIWQHAVDLVTEVDDDEDPVRPELRELLGKVVNVNGKKSLNLATGERYKVKAANRRAGRSLSGDLILLDELREHQSWDAWGAITKTTMARAMALILALSNAGDSSSIVLWFLRALAHIALGNPDGLDVGELADRPSDSEEDDGDSLAIFEWSATPGCAMDDRAEIAQANPSLGYTITLRAILAALRTDPENVFRTEVLCQWVENIEIGPIAAPLWADLADPDSERIGPATFAVEVANEQASAAIGVCGVTEDGTPRVALAAHADGSSWVIDWCVDHGVTSVTLDGRGAASVLVKPLEDAGIAVDSMTTSNVIEACALLQQRVKEARLVHPGDEPLDAAIKAARKRDVGDSGGWAFGRKASGADVTPLQAVTWALWAHLQAADYDVLDSIY